MASGHNEVWRPQEVNRLSVNNQMLSPWATTNENVIVILIEVLKYLIIIEYSYVQQNLRLHIIHNTLIFFLKD